MPSSPSPPSYSRPPPKRTYGRRGRISKPRAETPEPTTDTDVEDEPPAPTVKRQRMRGDPSPASHTEPGSGPFHPSTPPAESPFASPCGSPSASVAPAKISSRLAALVTDDANSRPLLSRSQTAPEGPLQSTASASTIARVEGRQGSQAPRPRRKMLSRAESMASQTLPTTNSAPSTPRTPRPLKITHSMPTPGSGRSHTSYDGEPGSPLIAPLVPVAVGSPSPAKAKRTYGGNRSFLASRPTDLDTALTEDAQPSYSELRKAYEVDTGDDDGIRNLAEEFNLARAPEPINDMRSKGENRLFMDDISLLLSDINNPMQSLALRRSSALDVLQKMLEGEWMARLRGHIETVFTALFSGSREDSFLGAACLLFLALLAKGGGLRRLLEGEENNVVALLESHIDLTSGPLDQGYRGRPSLSTQRLRALASKIFEEQEVGGSRGIASYVLAEAFQESTSTPQMLAAVAHEGLALRVFRRLKEDGALLRTRMELYRSSIDLLPRDGTIDLDAIEQSLRALSRIVAMSITDREQASTERECISSLLHLLVSAVAIVVDEEEEDEHVQRQAARCAVLSLQILAPLADPAHMADSAKEAFDAAHEDEATLAAFGRLMFQRNRWPELCKFTSRENNTSPTSSPVKPSENQRIEDGSDNLEAVELLIFLSPVLDRILPKSRSAAMKVATTSVSGCGKRSCIFGCRCATSISFAALVVSLYNEHLGEQEHGRALLLSMFLTVLLTRLLVSAPSQVRPLVERELAGSGWREQLVGLRDRLKHFEGIYATVKEQVGAAGIEDGDSMLDEALKELQPLIAAANG
ncbi:hypothetical protein CC85DRAFT_282511 [Cutaneotrichosporon oleaginosum]|uniref:Wings apart-like protein C-terminal domain-containing protein n=1 Tax=Cutaneotrichosporon oleaginosum TaxID=879819 RepID=A0A0J0XWK7_9TREE|nr:uncharacterized protein CC85DRAFT_282511 [Cutaneotrichosporon oleaginosum]KLT45433.1 hypothetical protein CC85DRAFT_282511 [Cutaneotrichosporon oleaginosum]TXT14606.1 hypothetical protein COLE_00799 [Cutaneotrichosporon oleaginosum]